MRPSVTAAAMLIALIPATVLAQSTRAEVLERRRAEKAAQLRPYEPGRLEKLVLEAEQGKLRRLIAPHNGPFVTYGYSHKPVGSGIGFGGGFRHDLLDRRARIELEAGESFRRYRMLRADFSLPRLLRERLELGVEALYRRHPQEDFYGPGPSARQEDRVSFLFSGREIQGRAIVRLQPWLNVGTRVGRLAPAVGSGTDKRYPSLEVRFSDAAAPGLEAQPNFTYGDAFAEVDYRDEPGNARAGGLYGVALRTYRDGALERYSFRSVELMLQQFVPLFDKKRVFAFQLGMVGTTPEDGSRVPFYLQPTLGGSRTVRSVADYRFRDTHVLWFNVEYRWEAFAALDMALFTDWGKVAPGASGLTLSNMKRAYGLGFRFNTAQTVLLRIDIAAGGNEGLQTFFKFSKAF